MRRLKFFFLMVTVSCGLNAPTKEEIAKTAFKKEATALQKQADEAQDNHLTLSCLIDTIRTNHEQAALDCIKLAELNPQKAAAAYHRACDRHNDGYSCFKVYMKSNDGTGKKDCTLISETRGNLSTQCFDVKNKQAKYCLAFAMLIQNEECGFYSPEEKQSLGTQAENRACHIDEYERFCVDRDRKALRAGQGQSEASTEEPSEATAE